MTNFPPVSDFTGSSVTEGGFKIAFGELHGFLTGLLGATGDPIDARGTLGLLGRAVEAKSAAYTVTAADCGKVFEASQTWPLSLPPTAIAGAAFFFTLVNAGAGTITIDPDGSELINGAATLEVGPRQAGMFICNGSGWLSLTPQIQTGATDATTGRLMSVGAFGLGAGTCADVGADAAGLVSQICRLTSGNRPDNANHHALHLSRIGDAQGAQIAVAEAAAGVAPTMAIRHRDDTGVWADWNALFGRLNLLGIVSETGGVPDGAVIERGSNANGEYVRFADGTQICHTVLSLDYVSSSKLTAIWTYPASFDSTQHLAISASLNISSFNANVTGPSIEEVRSVECSNITTTTARPNLFRILGLTDFASGDTTEASLTAIGRWF